jgi:hypothetical protein
VSSTAANTVIARRASTDGWTEIPPTDSQRWVLATSGIANAAASSSQHTPRPKRASLGSISSSLFRCMQTTRTPRPTTAAAACQVKK